MLAMVVSATGLCARNLWKMVFTLSRLWELSRGPISIGDLRPPCDCAHSNRFETKRRMLIVRSAMRRLPSFRNYSSLFRVNRLFCFTLLDKAYLQGRVYTDVRHSRRLELYARLQ